MLLSLQYSQGPFRNAMLDPCLTQQASTAQQLGSMPCLDLALTCLALTCMPCLDHVYVHLRRVRRSTCGVCGPVAGVHGPRPDPEPPPHLHPHPNHDKLNSICEYSLPAYFTASANIAYQPTLQHLRISPTSLLNSICEYSLPAYFTASANIAYQPTLQHLRI